MVETEGVHLFDRMRPAYQKWAEPVSRVFARTVVLLARDTPRKCGILRTLATGPAGH
jgi:hypothetical protein